MPEFFDLSVHRPLFNLNAEHYDAIGALARSEKMSNAELRMLGGGSCQAAILTTGDIGRMLRHFDMADAWTEENANLLADYLEEHMPSSTEEDFEASSYPFGAYTPLGKPNQKLFTLCAENATITQERAAARTLSEEFFGLDEEDTSEAWYDCKYAGEPWLARTYGKAAADKFDALLTAKGGLYLPPLVGFGAAEFTVEPSKS